MNHRYTFSDPIVVTMSIYLDFMELYPAAKTFVTMRATRKFQRRQLGSMEKERFTAEDEADARAALEDTEMDVTNVSLYDNDTVRNVLNRYPTPRRV